MWSCVASRSRSTATQRPYGASARTLQPRKSAEMRKTASSVATVVLIFSLLVAVPVSQASTVTSGIMQSTDGDSAGGVWLDVADDGVDVGVTTPGSNAEPAADSQPASYTYVPPATCDAKKITKLRKAETGSELEAAAAALSGGCKSALG